jgi:hypothetical protein
MNLNLLQRKLLDAARHMPADERVPYAFEQRVLSCLRGRVVLDGVTLWARALWRATAPCAAIMMLFITWSIITPTSSGRPESDLGQQLEAAMMASLPTEGELAW